jgi:competence protein ComEC
LLAYIAQIARWLAAPGWAQPELGLDGPAWLAALYAGVIVTVELSLLAAARRRGLALPWGAKAAAGKRRRGNRRPRRLALVAAVGLGAVLLLQLVTHSLGSAPRPADSLRVDVLDVGQGDAILLDPPGADPVLVDAGPPGAAVGDRLRELGVRSLAALVVTHDQSDHAGGAFGVLESLAVDRLAHGRPDPELVAAGVAAGARPLRLAEGSALRAGELRLEVLWPPAEILRAQVDDLNRHALVLLAEWRHFSILLSADAEAEAVPLDAGAVDVLKVAHHGSEDAGLGPLLERTVPKLAVISVGADNPYGHPTAQVLSELSRHGVPALRTDLAGTIAIEADGEGWSANPD